MSRTSVTAIAGVVFALATAGAACAQSQSPAPSAKWHPWFEIGGIYSSRDADNRGSFATSRGEVSIFSPLLSGQRDLLFAQVTGKFYEDDAKEGNVAVGIRHMTAWGFNLGAWLGADVRKTEIDNRFWQMSGGVEALSHNIDARINWYGPVTSPRLGVAGFAQVELAGSQIFITGGHEVALRGIDGEVGLRVPLEHLRIDPNAIELRAYAGGYYFDHSQAISDIKGVKGRLELRVNDVFAGLPGSRLTAEYEVSHDDYRDTIHQAGLRVRIPLSFSRAQTSLRTMTPQERRMLDGLQRDADIITVRSRGEKVEDFLTGTDFDRVAHAGGAASVTRASTQAGSNSLIILNGTVVGGQILRGNQTLIGGGTTIYVRGLASGLVLPFTAPGAAGRLTSPAIDVDSLLLTGSSIHVAGLTIVGGGPAGIGDGVDVGSNNRNVFLIGLDISDTGGDGIDIDDDNQVTVRNVTTTDTDESGIDINDGNSVVVSNVSILNAGSDGIQINDDNTVTLSDITIRNSRSDGIEIDDNNTVTITGGSITNPGSDGIEIDDGNRVTISGLVISNMRNGGDGIFIDDDNVLTLTNVTIRGPNGDDGIELDNNNRLTIASSIITNIAFGIFAFGDDNVISITDTTISDIEFDGLLVFGVDNVINIQGARFDTIGFDALSIHAPATLFISETTFAGDIGFSAFFFTAPVTVASGSNGNVNNATFGFQICDVTFGGSFTGTIRFVDGTALRDNVAPCN